MNKEFFRTLDMLDDQKAKDHFGVTDDFLKAGWLLKDGKVLDFSGGRSYKYLEHSDILLPYIEDEGVDVDYQEYRSIINKYTGYGNIRLHGLSVHGYGVEIKKEPTAQQYSVLKAIIRYVYDDSDDNHFFIDLANSGKVLSYKGGEVKPDKIINDIKNSFAGKKIYKSQIAQFREKKELRPIEKLQQLDMSDGQKAIKQFGVTDDFLKAGWLLKDGSMLDFSKGSSIKAILHQEIVDSYATDDEYEDIMSVVSIESIIKKYCSYGNIRLTFSNNAGGIELSEVPTKTQYYILSEIIDELADTGNEPGLHLDIIGSNEIKFYEFGDLNSIRIINDIKNHFTGKKVYPSQLAKFRERYIKEFKKYDTLASYLSSQSWVYHGTNQDFMSFNKGLKGQDIKAKSAKEGYWFTASKEEAQQYADYSAKRSVPNQVQHEKEVDRLLKDIELANKMRDFDTAENLETQLEDLEISAIQAEPSGQRVIEVVLSMKKPLMVDAGIEGFNHMDVIEDARVRGYDSIIFNNMSDAPLASTDPTTHYMVFKKEQIKTKQQLIDIWNKAHRVKESYIKEPRARAYLSPEYGL